MSELKAAHEKKGGFILILTMLIVSITLAISFSIYTISIKEVVLGAYMRDSERAFMAADRAIECALFWDRSVFPGPNGLAHTIFATSTIFTPPVGANTAICNVGVGGGFGNKQLNLVADTNWLVYSLTPTSGFTSYNLIFSDGAYAEVVVYKYGINTDITANGYNVAPGLGGNRRTQRTIYATYNL